MQRQGPKRIKKPIRVLSLLIRCNVLGRWGNQFDKRRERMSDTIKKQIQDLLNKRKQKLDRIRDISDSVRKLADEISKLKREYGISTSENDGALRKSIKFMELKISTENLPLKMERELAERIAEMEKRIREIKEIEKKRSRIGELESEIKKMKMERDTLKNDVDKDIMEVESLRREKVVADEREAGKFDDFCLGDLVTVKRNGKKPEEN